MEEALQFLTKSHYIKLILLYEYRKYTRIMYVQQSLFKILYNNFFYYYVFIIKKLIYRTKNFQSLQYLLAIIHLFVYKEMQF